MRNQVSQPKAMAARPTLHISFGVPRGLQSKRRIQGERGSMIRRENVPAVTTLIRVIT